MNGLERTLFVYHVMQNAYLGAQVQHVVTVYCYGYSDGEPLKIGDD